MSTRLNTPRSTSAIAALGLSMALSLGIAIGTAPAPQDHPTPKPAAAGLSALSVDAVHSSVIFKIKHANIASFYGRFNDVSGTVSFDEVTSSNVALDVAIKAGSVDTNNADRDTHIKSEAFFDADKYPTLSFKSTAAKKTGDHTFDVTGDLTFHGVTKPITVSLTHTGSADLPRMGHVVGFETTFTIKRSDYGVKAYVNEGMLGDDVTLTVSLEATPAKK